MFLCLLLCICSSIVIFFYSFFRYFFVLLVFVFFFKQKTAYEMRISDWSSDVCSSDLWTLGHRLLGLENLVLIPGTVGAAPIQSIGAYGVEVGEFIEVVEAFDRRSMSACRLSRSDCAFGYRDSAFKREPERWIITAVQFRLPRQRELMIDYAGVPEELAAMGANPPRPAPVAQAIARLPNRNLPNPEIGRAHV